MINKRALMDLVARAERGVLLPGEAAILRDAVDLLDDLAMTLDQVMKGSANALLRGQSLDYAPSDTQSFRTVGGDDDAPGRP